jgi:hypothetical protein
VLVVKDQLKSLAMALPLKSFTPPDPPLMVTEYVVRGKSSTVGVRVAVDVAVVYVTLAGTTLLEESCITTVTALIVEDVIGSLNVAVAEIPRLTPELWSAGVTELTVGTVLEFMGEKTTSTQ